MSEDRGSSVSSTPFEFEILKSNLCVLDDARQVGLEFSGWGTFFRAWALIAAAQERIRLVFCGLKGNEITNVNCVSLSSHVIPVRAFLSILLCLVRSPGTVMQHSQRAHDVNRCLNTLLETMG